MALSLEQFSKLTEASGLMSASDIQAFVAALPEAVRPQDGKELARALVTQKKLTAYQAEEIYARRGKNLTLGNYLILEKLGQGGMGMVLKAEHKRMKRLVAIKVLPTELTKDEIATKRFQREVEAAAKLEHPNIVTAHDADEAHGVHFLVMEYVEGRDLSATVKKSGPLSVSQAVDCILQAARGLEYAHQHGVVHRDIKPANLLLDKSGTVKILDMGLARIDAGEADDATQAALTGTGMVMGTIDYMSPEQAVDTRSAGPQADIYSLGASLYYLLTGNPIVTGNTIGKKLQTLMTGRGLPTSIREHRGDVPEELDAVFQQMVAHDKEARYASMTEVVAVLEEVLATVPGDSSAGTSLASVGTSRGSVVDLVLNDLKKTIITGTTRLVPGAAKTLGDASAERTLRGGRRILAASLVLLPLIGAVLWGISGRDGRQPVNPGENLASGTTVGTPAAEEASTRLTPYEILTSPDYEWTEPENLGPAVNTSEADTYPTLSADGLRLIYRSYRRYGLCESTRASVDEPFGPGVPLGPEFGNESATMRAALSGDGLTLVFVSDRPGGSGDWDLWQATRPTLDRPFGKPVCLTALNSAERENYPTLSSDGLTVWFDSNRPNPLRQAIWTSRRASLAAEFDPPVPFALPMALGPNSYLSVAGTCLSADARVLVFAPNFGGGDSTDLHISVRPTQQAPFGVAEKLALPVNSASGDEFPTLSADGTTLVFASQRPGGLGGTDLWMTRRVPKAKQGAAGDEWISLFNGKDLSGWKRRAGDAGTWRVDNGVLIGTGGDPFSYLISERGDFRDFQLRVETRINSQGSAGVGCRTQAAGTSLDLENGRGGALGYLAKINANSADPRRSGGLYVMESTGFQRGHRPHTSPVKADEWFSLEVIVQGDRILIQVNGETITDFRDDQRAFTVGHIALQAFRPESVVEFRKIEVRELSEERR